MIILRRSLIIVAKGPEATAGSYLRRSKSQGIMIAITEATIIVINMERARITPITNEPCQKQAIRETKIPRITDIAILTFSS